MNTTIRNFLMVTLAVFLPCFGLCLNAEAAYGFEVPLQIQQDLSDGYNALLPDVAYNPASEQYLVVWQEGEPQRSDPFGVAKVRAQRYDRQGNALGELLTLSHAAADAYAPSVAAGNSTTWRVAWESEYKVGILAFTDVKTCLVDSDGSVSDYDFAVTKSGNSKSLVTDPAQIGDVQVGSSTLNGRYLVAWSVDESLFSSLEIRGHLYGEGSQPVSSAYDDGFEIGEGGYSAHAAVSREGQNFFVVWEDDDNRIRGRSIPGSSDGSSLGSIFTIADGGNEALTNPAVCGHPDFNNWLVAYETVKDNNRDVASAFVGSSSVSWTQPLATSSSIETKPSIGLSGDDFFVAWGTGASGWAGDFDVVGKFVTTGQSVSSTALTLSDGLANGIQYASPRVAGTHTTDPEFFAIWDSSIGTNYLSRYGEIAAVPLSFTRELQSVAVLPGESVVLSFAAAGNVESIRWYKDDVLVQEGGYSYFVASADELDEGIYRVEISDDEGTSLSGASVIVGNGPSEPSTGTTQVITVDEWDPAITLADWQRMGLRGLNCDGDRLIIGHGNIGSSNEYGRTGASIFELNGQGEWYRSALLAVSNFEGDSRYSVDLFGDVAVIGQLFDRIVTVFERDSSGAWGEVQIISSEGDVRYFGEDVWLDAGRLFVNGYEREPIDGRNASYFTETTYIYKRSTSGLWELSGQLKIPFDEPASPSGEAQPGMISADGDWAVRQVWPDKTYVFHYDAFEGSWEIEDILYTSPHNNDKMGYRVGISGNSIFVGLKEFRRLSSGKWVEVENPVNLESFYDDLRNDSVTNQNISFSGRTLTVSQFGEASSGDYYLWRVSQMSRSSSGAFEEVAGHLSKLRNRWGEPTGYVGYDRFGGVAIGTDYIFFSGNGGVSIAHRRQAAASSRFSIPEGLELLQVTSETVSVSWMAENEIGAVCFLSRNKDFSDIVRDTSVNAGTSSEYTFTDLDPNTTYYVSIRTESPDGNSPLAVPLEVTTLPASPTWPANPFPTKDRDSFSVTWNPVEGATAYYVDVAIDPSFDSESMLFVGDEMRIEGATTATVEINNVDDVNRSMTFYIRVRAVTASGTSEPSETLLFKFDPIIDSFELEAGAATTTAQAVTLDFDTSNGIPTHYRASESSVLAAVPWQDYDPNAVPTFTLSSGFGLKTVYLELKHDLGESGVLSDTIEWIAIQLDRPTNLRVTTATDEKFRFEWDSVAGASAYQFFHLAGSSTNQLYVDVFMNQAYGFISGTTSTVYELRVRALGADEAQHSEWTYLTFKYDPAILDFKLDSGATTTESAEVRLNFENVDGIATHYRVGESANLSGADWEAYIADAVHTYTLSAGEGVKTVYLELKHDTGTSAVAVDSIERAYPAQTGVAPTEEVIAERLPGQSFNGTTFTSPARFSWNGELGNWSYEKVSGSVGKLIQTYDEDGNDPGVYREEVLLTFSSETAGTYSYREFEGDAQTVEIVGDFDFPWLADEPQSWYAGSSDLGGDWRWLPWLRSFNISQAPWIFHPQHGWLYPFGEDPATGMYFWDVRQQTFVYTTSGLYPTMFRFADGKWIRYQIGSTQPRWFVDLLTGVWAQVE